MVQVHVTEGVVEGELVSNEYGGTYHSFKGIPYAAPPLGELRYKAPQSPKPWDGVRSAKEFASVCFQYNILVAPTPFGSEDCLYINVYTPDVKPTAPLPVMVWIHGGGFLWGSGNDDFYGPKFLVRHGVILVTFNYRLEALGFLCLDTEDIPGNAGMKDQVAALRWVKKNIGNFGGDSENITIFGESAGAASVSYHLVSPMSKGLFKRAIVQSGALSCWWAQAFEPRERALILAKRLGFTSEEDNELYEFFKLAPIESLVHLDLPVIQSHKPHELSFSIVSEKKFGDNELFFHGDVIDALKNGAHEEVDVITGYTEDEGLMAFGVGENKTATYIELANKYIEFFTPKTIMLYRPIQKQLEIGKRFKSFYMKNPIVRDEDFPQMLKFLSMDMFVYGVILQGKILNKTNRKTYFYKFTCKSERNVLAHLLGLSSVIGDKTVVSHADDLMYLFNNVVVPQKLEAGSPTYEMVDRFTKLWTNFAKYGNPTPDSSLGANWSPYSEENPVYLDIGNELVTKMNPEQEELKFWEDIFKECLPHWTS